MDIKDHIIIAKDFHRDPGARKESDGKNSGELFFTELLRPKFEKALREKHMILIDLDDVLGYPSSFVSGAFGTLSIEFGSDLVMKHIKFKSDRRPIRIKKFESEILYPKKQHV